MRAFLDVSDYRHTYSKKRVNLLEIYNSDTLVLIISALNYILQPSDMSAADEPRILCIVHDAVSPNSSSMFTMNLPASTTCHKFLGDVMNKIGCSSDEVELIFELNSAGGDQEQVCQDWTFIIHRLMAHSPGTRRGRFCEHIYDLCVRIDNT